MNVYEIKAAAASYLRRNLDEFVVNSVDLALVALNQARMDAELNNNFEFSRKLVTLDVVSNIGGSLDDAVLFGTTTPVGIKGIVDVGVFDTYGNLRGVEWTTVSESLGRGRMENSFYGVSRYPTDGEALSGASGQSRFAFSGQNVYFFPRAQDVSTYPLGIEAYTFTADWTPDDNDLATGPWLTKGHQYLTWKTVVHLNQLVKEFVPRQEGNLPPPDTMATAGLASFISWDVFMYEQFRRHGR